MKRLAKIFTVAIMAYILAVLVVSPELCINNGRAAVELCIKTVIPTLFPFMVCSGLFTALGLSRLCSHFLSPVMKPVFNVSGSGAIAFILGIISGYPLGAATAAMLYGKGECSRSEAERLIAFCNNSGPLFIIGVVGVSVLNNPQLGYMLYGIHILSAVLVGIIFRFYGGSEKERGMVLPPSVKYKDSGSMEAIAEAVDTAVTSILKVCAYVVLFSVAAACLPKGRHTPVLHSFFEITGGIGSVSEMDIDAFLKLPVISFFLAFSGVSVILQVNSVISPYGLSVKPYITGKLLQGIIAFVITYIIQLKFPVTTDVFASGEEGLFKTITADIAFYISVVSCLCGGLFLTLASAVAYVFQKLRMGN